jgi:DNA recombination protein RmuC
VAHLWRQEAQSKNAQEIAKRGAELYDKLTAFVADLDSVGNRLEDAQKSFGEAKKKLVSGRGNVIRQAQMLHELGVKSTKQLPRSLVDESMESDNRPDLDMTFVVEGNSGTPAQPALSPSRSGT